MCAATRPYVSPNVQPPQRQARYRGITPEMGLSNRSEIGSKSLLPESEMPCHFILPDIFTPQVHRHLKSPGPPRQAFLKREKLRYVDCNTVKLLDVPPAPIAL